MSNTEKHYPDTAIDEGVIEILTAISIVSKRLARNIEALHQHSRSTEGGKQDEQNERYGYDHRRTAYCCCRY